jgi:hypothetical protein
VQPGVVSSLLIGGSASTRGPQRVSFEVRMLGSQPLAFITFRNFYASHISVRQLVERSSSDRNGSGRLRDAAGRRVWTTVLHRLSLMQRPHNEEEAQLSWCVPVKQLNERFDAACTTRVLRIDCFQCSPNWIAVGVRDVQLWSAAAPEQQQAQKQNAIPSVSRPSSARSGLQVRSSAAGAASAAARQPVTQSTGSSVDEWLRTFAPPSSSSSRIASSRTVRSRIDAVLAAFAHD